MSTEAVVQTEDEAGVCLANTRRRLDQRIEHRPELGARLADDLEHVAGRGLIFEQLLQIVGALPQFSEQPRILDRDHRLVGEGRDQRDLAFRKRLDPRRGRAR